MIGLVGDGSPEGWLLHHGHGVGGIDEGRAEDIAHGWARLSLMLPNTTSLAPDQVITGVEEK
jgi:hypothetical protein